MGAKNLIYREWSEKNSLNFTFICLGVEKIDFQIPHEKGNRFPRV